MIIHSSGLHLFSYGTFFKDETLIASNFAAQAIATKEVLDDNLKTLITEKNRKIVTVRTDDLVCFLFYDTPISESIAREFAKKILSKFLEEYSDALKDNMANVKQYAPFKEKIKDDIEKFKALTKRNQEDILKIITVEICWNNNADQNVTLQLNRQAELKIKIANLNNFPITITKIEKIYPHTACSVDSVYPNDIGYANGNIIIDKEIYETPLEITVNLTPKKIGEFQLWPVMYVKYNNLNLPPKNIPGSYIIIND